MAQGPPPIKLGKVDFLVKTYNTRKCQAPLAWALFRHEKPELLQRLEEHVSSGKCMASKSFHIHNDLLAKAGGMTSETKPKDWDYAWHDEHKDSPRFIAYREYCIKNNLHH